MCTCLVFQTLGGAFSLSGAQAGFANRVISALATSAPSVDPKALIATGAAELLQVFSPDQIPGILVAYMTGLKAAFAVAIGMAVISFLLSLLCPCPLEEGSCRRHGRWYGVTP